jgi:hypothetical protein
VIINSAGITGTVSSYVATNYTVINDTRRRDYTVIIDYGQELDNRYINRPQALPPRPEKRLGAAVLAIPAPIELTSRPMLRLPPRAPVLPSVWLRSRAGAPRGRRPLRSRPGRRRGTVGAGAPEERADGGLQVEDRLP